MKKSIGATTILYPTPVFIVGTYDKDGRANAMAVAWGGICCSDPPCVAISLRKATYTYGNIVARKAFTVSLPSEKFVKEADYFGMVSGRDEDKFSVSGLTPARAKTVDAPYVEEFPFVIECSLLKTVEIGLHTQFIGKVQDIRVEESALGRDGVPDISLVKPLLFDPGRGTYHGAGGLVAKAFSCGREIARRKQRK